MINGVQKKSWIGIPSWIILGAIMILVPIFVFWTIQNINKQKEQMTLLLLEKGAALIRSFEAGTRTGMMGMMGMRGSGFQLQKLLSETAQLPDILYLIVTDVQGTILAHNDPARIGGSYGLDLDLETVFRSEALLWRQVVEKNGGPAVFEVFRRFTPTFVPPRGGRSMKRQSWHHDFQELKEAFEENRQIIFVGMDTVALEEARKEDTRHTVLMAVVLLLIGFGGVLTLFLAQAYRSTRTSLTRIKAFSDNVVENMPIGLVAVNGEGRIASLNQEAESVLHLSSRDISDKRADEILPEPLWSLIDEVAGENKIRDLTEVQHLKKEIERSQRLVSLGRLAAGIAHEIRNPLSSIKGFATYFRDRYRENPEDQATATIMIHEVDRLNRVISQLLEFARPVKIQKRSVPIHMVIEHALKMIEKQAETKGIHIEKDLSSKIREVPMDPDRFNQVLLNLCLNAVEAMEGGGTLSIGLHACGDSGKVEITVSDTGVGITRENLVHIFDPYFTTRPSGTGLGLAIVHKIVESHGGQVQVESEVGKGTRVSIMLPKEDS